MKIIAALNAIYQHPRLQHDFKLTVFPSISHCGECDAIRRDKRQCMGLVALHYVSDCVFPKQCLLGRFLFGVLVCVLRKSPCGSFVGVVAVYPDGLSDGKRNNTYVFSPDGRRNTAKACSFIRMANVIKLFVVLFQKDIMMVYTSKQSKQRKAPMASCTVPTYGSQAIEPQRASIGFTTRWYQMEEKGCQANTVWGQCAGIIFCILYMLARKEGMDSIAASLISSFRAKPCQTNSTARVAPARPRAPQRPELQAVASSSSSSAVITLESDTQHTVVVFSIDVFNHCSILGSVVISL